MLSAKQQTRLVVFDLGRVLIRICSSWDEAFVRAGVKPPNFSDPVLMRELAVLGRRCEVGQADEAEFLLGMSALLRLSEQQVLAASSHFLVGAYDGVGEFLSQLKQAGLSTACLSNTNDSHWRLMTGGTSHAALPLGLLDHRFASHLLKMRKPDGEIYAAVEKATGFAGPSIIFFDDLPENVQASLERGWHGVLVPRVPQTVPFMREQLRLLGVNV